MPIIHRPLAFGLALVTVYVGVSGSREQELVTAGLRVPERQRLELVIATDAKSSVLDREKIASLGLIPIGEGQFNVSLQLRPDEGLPLVLELLVLEGEFRNQMYDGILGRDALKDCLLTLDRIALHWLFRLPAVPPGGR